MAFGSLSGRRGDGVVLCNPNPGHPLTSQPPSSSSGVTVTVKPSPEVPEGTTATMNCSAIPWVGEEANYTWYKNSRWLREGPASSLVLAPVSSIDTGSYRCRASGTRGSAASAPLSLNVLCEYPSAPWGQATGQDGVQSPWHGLCWMHPAQHHVSHLHGPAMARGPSSSSSSSPCPAPLLSGQGKRTSGFCLAVAADAPQKSDWESMCSEPGGCSSWGGGSEGLERV